MTEREQEIGSAMPPELDALPRLGGFRLRGMQMTRLETFIDAAFAFAISMLVIATNQMPTKIDELYFALRDVPSFICSVVVIGIFWRGHWLWSRRYGLEDGTSIFISWAMIVTILIYIYPLKAIFGSMWFLLSDGHLGQTLGLGFNSKTRGLFAIYAVGFTAIALEILLLNLRAWRVRDALRLDEREKFITKSEIMGWSLPVTVGLLSVILALTLPIQHIAWSGWIYFSMALLVPLHRKLRQRHLKRAA